MFLHNSSAWSFDSCLAFRFPLALPARSAAIYMSPRIVVFSTRRHAPRTHPKPNGVHYFHESAKKRRHTSNEESLTNWALKQQRTAGQFRRGCGKIYPPIVLSARRVRTAGVPFVCFTWTQRTVLVWLVPCLRFCFLITNGLISPFCEAS